MFSLIDIFVNGHNYINSKYKLLKMDIAMLYIPHKHKARHFPIHKIYKNILFGFSKLSINECIFSMLIITLINHFINYNFNISNTSLIHKQLLP